MYDKLFLLVILTLIRNIPQINKYIYLLLIVLGILYDKTRNFQYSLFISLIVFLGYTKYNYYVSEDTRTSNLYNNLFFVLFIGFILYYNNFGKVLKNIDSYIPFLNFILILYIFVSFIEFIIHKHIMHCKEDDPIYQLFKWIPEASHTCKAHIKHHIDTKPNMDLKDDYSQNALVFDWHVVSILFIPVFIAFLLANYLSQLNVSIWIILGLCIVSVIFICYLWNKTHPFFHKKELQNFTIKEGPYEEKLNIDFIGDMLYDNHVMHHLQKGEKKGNYNIIALGADEWMGKNVKVADNEEYCKTHMNEEICSVYNL